MTLGPPDWSRLFPEADYRFHMGVRPGDGAAFFGPTAAREGLLAERGRWLEDCPGEYAAMGPDAGELLEEAIALAVGWGVPGLAGLPNASGSTPLDRCVALARRWEPDFLLLRQGADGAFRLVGGSVCFPSSWSLQEKMGRPVAEIHGVVPGLNAGLSRQIDTFLARVSPGAAWERENWGLSGDDELNRHPRRHLPGLNADVTLDAAWLRIEHQAFVRMPRTGGLLFGIRLSLHPFRALAAHPVAAKGLARALRTMPAEVARYKGLAEAIAPLVRALEN